jgi:hypothetical protein
MLDAKVIKQKLKPNDIMKLLKHLGGEPIESGNVIKSKTICHLGSTHKLFYYPDSQSFHCYTQCSCNYDVFGIVAQVFSMSFSESVKYVADFFGIQSTGVHVHHKKLNDWDIFAQKDIIKDKQETIITPTIYNDNILNIFPKFSYEGWLQENISHETMEKYDIRYNLLHHQIIIPHRDIDNNLIGIKARNLDPERIKSAKYIPLTYNNVTYSYPTSASFYGLNHNIDTIKKIKKIVLFESEKSVLKSDSLYGDNNFTASVNGMNISKQQRRILQELDIQKVIICFDKLN